MRKSHLLKNKNGITLISLVITIIILIILAGISISMFSGDNGILRKAGRNNIATELTQAQEQVNIALAEEKLKYGDMYNVDNYTTLESFNPIIKNKYSDKLGIFEGEIFIKKDASEEIKSVAREYGINVIEEATKDENNQVVLKNVKKLKSYKIYGESIQESENLLDPSTAYTTDYYLNSSGEEVENNNWRYTDYIEVDGYSFTLKINTGNAPAICAYDENQNFIAGVNYANKTEVKISSTTLIKYIRFSFYKNTTLSNISLTEDVSPNNPIEIQSVGDLVTEGEYKGEYKVPITVRGKNLLKTDMVAAEANGIRNPKNPIKLISDYGTTIDSTDFSDNVVQVTQTPNLSYGSDSYRNGYVAFNIPELVEGQKYELSFDVDILNNPLNATRFIMYLNGAAPVIKGFFENNNQRINCTFTYTKSTYVRQYMEIRCMGMSFIASNFMITEQDQDSNYEPYIEPKTHNIYLDEPLRKVADYADYIDFENKKVVRVIQKAFIDGVNQKIGEVDGVYEKYSKVIKMYSNRRCFNSVPNVISNKFAPIKTENDVYQVVGKTTNQWVVFCLPITCTTSDEANTWFSNNPTELYYVLNEESISEKSIELPKLPTLDETNIITIDTITSPSNVVIEHFP